MEPDQIPTLMRRYQPIYAGADADLLADIDARYGRGTMRDWAVFTHTAAALCRESGRERIDANVVDNAFGLLGGAVRV